MCFEEDVTERYVWYLGCNQQRKMFAISDQNSGPSSKLYEFQTFTRPRLKDFWQP